MDGAATLADCARHPLLPSGSRDCLHCFLVHSPDLLRFISLKFDSAFSLTVEFDFVLEIEACGR